jgi:MFS family permease
MNKKIFITLFIATIITMAGLGIIDPILPLYAKSMKATGVQLGIIFAGFALSRSIFAPIIGQYSDRHGRKNLMIAGLVLSFYMLFGSIMQYPFGLISDRFPSQKVNLILMGGTCSALSMCAVAYSQSMLMFMILATSMGAFSSVSRASVVAIRTERGRIYGMGSVTGAFTTSLSIGQVLGPILFGVIADISSIPAAFLVGGLVGLTGTIAAFIFFKSETAGRKK